MKINFLNLFFKLRNTFLYGITDIFSNVEIETSSKCNRRCSYCPNSRFNRGNYFMNESLFKKIILELKNLKFKGNLRPHFYNEPLLDRRLPKLIQFAHINLPKVNIILHTNGDYLTESLFDKLISSGVNTIVATGHEGMLGKHIIKLSQMPKYHKYLSMPVIKPGMPLFNRGGLVAVDKLIRIDKCNLSHDYLIIDYKGNILLCCNDYLSSVVYGNVNKEKIINIWNKENYQIIRNTTRKGIFILEICKRCLNKTDSYIPKISLRTGF